MFADICEPQENLTCGLNGENVTVTFLFMNHSMDMSCIYIDYGSKNNVILFSTLCNSAFLRFEPIGDGVGPVLVRSTRVLGLYFSPLYNNYTDEYYAISYSFWSTIKFSQTLYICCEYTVVFII